MTETTFTPGPWHRDGFNLAAIIRLKYPKEHPECKHIGGTYETIARCEGDNWNANSCLIAAAPDLLEAAKEMLAAWNKRKAVDATRLAKAVAKAEGK